MGGFGSGFQEKPEIKLFRKIHKDKSGCWIFKHYKTDHYPAFDFHGQTMGAHRASYLMFKGRIPRGKLVLHSCDNRKCVNPDHLSIGTYKENARQMVSRGRDGGWKRVKRICVKGHPLIKSNLYINPTSGSRRCRMCINGYRKRSRR
jgi:hypothetical protein